MMDKFTPQSQYIPSPPMAGAARVKNHSFHSGFTLVELLVVMSIVALLIAMLLPSLATARQQARIALCGNNLHQIGIAMGSYQADSNTYYPAFGGTATWNAGGTYASVVTDPWAWFPWMGATTAHGGQGRSLDTFFNQYASGSNQNTRGIGACPVQNWNPTTMDYAPTHADHQNFDYRTNLYPTYLSGPAYSFYTGRKSYNTTGLGNDYNFDTTQRRDDPNELLASDMTIKTSGTTQTYGIGTQKYAYTISAAVPWFNPHNNRSCTTTREGNAKVLIASGAVFDFNFADSKTIKITSYGTPTIEIWTRAKLKGPKTGELNGPYFSYTN